MHIEWHHFTNGSVIHMNDKYILLLSNRRVIYIWMMLGQILWGIFAAVTGNLNMLVVLANSENLIIELENIQAAL